MRVHTLFEGAAASAASAALAAAARAAACSARDGRLVVRRGGAASAGAVTTGSAGVADTAGVGGATSGAGTVIAGFATAPGTGSPSALSPGVSGICAQPEARSRMSGSAIFECILLLTPCTKRPHGSGRPCLKSRQKLLKNQATACIARCYLANRGTAPGAKQGLSTSRSSSRRFLALAPLTATAALQNLFFQSRIAASTLTGSLRGLPAYRLADSTT